jgi:TnpA family transposase
MPKIRILSPAERKAFQLPPIFQLNEKTTYFEISDATKKILDVIRSPHHKVGFILQLGYFRRAGRFFSSTQFHQQDITFVSKLLAIDHHKIAIEKYKDHNFRQDQQKILGIMGFQSFDCHAQSRLLLAQEVTRLVEKQIRPKMIIFYLSHFFFQKKIEKPSYQILAETILQTMTRFETELLSILERTLTKQHMEILDQLLPNIDLGKSIKSKSYYARAPLVALREFPLSSRPGKIKKSVDGFLTIKKIFESTQTALQPLSLSPNALKYYAVWVQKAKITQLVQINNPYKRYLYLLAFIAHQYYYRQDLLVDTLLQSVQSTLNRIEKKQHEEDKNTKQEKERATHLLSMSYRDKTELLAKIHSIINIERLSAEEKVTQIKQLVSQEDRSDPAIAACIEKLDKQIINSLNETNFYNSLENQSLTLQKRLSRIIKNLDFNALNSKLSLLEAINHFRETDGEIGYNPPRSFLEQQTLSYLLDNKGKVRRSLYKSLLFVHIADAIKSGEINLMHSYRYLSIDEYLISKKSWQVNRQDYLDRAELGIYSSVKDTIAPIQKKLDEQYHTVNESINSGKNQHISFNKVGEVIVDTPKVEKIETLRIAELLKQENYISILDVLGMIDRLTDFSECLQHYRVVQQIKRPKPIIFYAGLMAKGCNIGLGKLASVSKGINGNTLETVVNWHFSNDHLMAANNRIIRFINKLALPNIMKRTLGKLHTSSDGQKRNVDLDSILANFSFKYHGSGRGVSIYDFIDERHVLFHSLVMSSAEREAAYVIDGIMCNDEIKSDVHSTDTHGYSDLVFSITHLLGISFAPRLAKIKKRTLYSFEKRNLYQKKGYKILPDQTINLRLIEDNWDDILRLVATIKLKENTASQILKRLSSYAKDNPLYKGLKEFGKLIKTMFLLAYMDNLELRQAIQKQLNKIELANKFSDAVFFDNNQEFKQGSREEQEISMSCKILLQNAIVLWNYLCLSQLLATAADPAKRDELLKIIKNGSIMSWQHINMLGEYDFRNKPASNEPIFDIEKILAWGA